MKSTHIALYIFLGLSSWCTAKIPFQVIQKVYILAPKTVLKIRLANVDSLFVQQTGLIERLAEQRLPATTVAKIVEQAVGDHTEFLSTVLPDYLILPTIKRFLQDRTVLYEKILKEHPEALEELRRCGIYRPKTFSNEP